MNYNNASAKGICRKILQLDLKIKELRYPDEACYLVSLDKIYNDVYTGRSTLMQDKPIIAFDYTFSIVYKDFDYYEEEQSILNVYFSEFELARRAIYNEKINIEHIQNVIADNRAFNGFNKSEYTLFLTGLLHGAKLPENVELWMRLNGYF